MAAAAHHRDAISAALNPEQCEVVDAERTKAMLIQAGPGSGKTRTVLYRISRLIQRHAVRPSSILAISFTRAGTQELRSRLGTQLGHDARSVKVTTFHGFALWMLRHFGDAVDWMPSPMLIMNDHEQRDVVMKLLVDRYYLEAKAEEELRKAAAAAQAAAEGKAAPAWPVSQPEPDYFYLTHDDTTWEYRCEGLRPDGSIVQYTSTDKAHKQHVKMVERQATNLLDYLNTAKNAGFSPPWTQYITEKSSADAARRLRVMHEFEAHREAQGYVTFADAILLATRLLKELPDARRWVQERFQYIFCDEVQDTSLSQCYFLMEIADATVRAGQTHPYMTLCGDPNQAIFGFQAGDTLVLQLLKERYPSLETRYLTCNYRSAEGVVTCFNALHSLFGTPKQCRVIRFVLQYPTPQDRPVRVVYPHDEALEAEYVVNEIQQLVSSGTCELQDIAILTRRKYAVLQYADLFHRLGIPATRHHSKLQSAPFARGVVHLLRLLVSNGTDDEAAIDLLLYLLRQETHRPMAVPTPLLQLLRRIAETGMAAVGEAGEYVASLVPAARLLPPLSRLTAMQVAERADEYDKRVKQKRKRKDSGGGAGSGSRKAAKVSSSSSAGGAGAAASADEEGGALDDADGNALLGAVQPQHVTVLQKLREMYLDCLTQVGELELNAFVKKCADAVCKGQREYSDGAVIKRDIDKLTNFQALRAPARTTATASSWIRRHPPASETFPVMLLGHATRFFVPYLSKTNSPAPSRFIRHAQRAAGETWVKGSKDPAVYREQLRAYTEHLAAELDMAESAEEQAAAASAAATGGAGAAAAATAASSSSSSSSSSSAATAAAADATEDEANHAPAVTEQKLLSARETSDAVYLGTAHSAKGLEWKVVFVVRAVDGEFPGKAGMADDEARLKSPPRRTAAATAAATAATATAASSAAAATSAATAAESDGRGRAAELPAAARVPATVEAAWKRYTGSSAEEERCLFGVAVSRAKDRLYLLAPKYVQVWQERGMENIEPGLSPYLGALLSCAEARKHIQVQAWHHSREPVQHLTHSDGTSATAAVSSGGGAGGAGGAGGSGSGGTR